MLWTAASAFVAVLFATGTTSVGFKKRIGITTINRSQSLIWGIRLNIITSLILIDIKDWEFFQNWWCFSKALRAQKYWLCSTLFGRFVGKCGHWKCLKKEPHILLTCGRLAILRWCLLHSLTNLYASDTTAFVQQVGNAPLPSGSRYIIDRDRRIPKTKLMFWLSASWSWHFNNYTSDGMSTGNGLSAILTNLCAVRHW